jgi:hypothetical protein
MSKKNWFLIIGLASLALIFLSFVGYVVKKTNERNIEIRRTNKENAEKSEEQKKKIMECIKELKTKVDEAQSISLKILTIIGNFNTPINYYTLGNFLGELNFNLKKFNEIKNGLSKIQEKTDEQLMEISVRSEMQGTLQEFQKYFNKVSKISFINTAKQIKIHDLVIIQNKELIINPQIFECFTEEQQTIIKKLMEETEKNLNTPSSILKNNSVEKATEKEITQNKYINKFNSYIKIFLRIYILLKLD